MQLTPNEKRTHEPMRPTFPIYEAEKCFALNKLQTTGKRTVCSEEKKDIFSEEYTVCYPGEHSPQVRSNKPTSYNSLLCCRCPLHPVHTCESAPLPVLTRRSGPLLRYAEALLAAPHRAPLPQHFRDLH